MILVIICLFPFGASGQPDETFRIGFTSSVFGEVNENDALAAVRAWSQALVRERHISAVPISVVFNNLSEIKAALTGKSVEALNMTLVEYAEVRELVADNAIVFGVISGSITEEYVLLVNRKSNIEKLSDLEGRTIGFLSSVRASLAPVWIDTLLIREGLKPADTFFGKMTTDPKVGNLLLSTFFGKLDACVSTRRGFDIMTELNPQTGQQLRVLAASPPLVPLIFCFRKGYESPVRDQILKEISQWHLSVAGKQSLTIFQTDSLEEQPISCLDNSLNLLGEHKELTAKTGTRQAESSKTDSIGAGK